VLTGLFARLLHATRAIDRAYQRFDGARRELVLALASDRLLARYNDLAYARSKSYHPQAAEYRTGLLAWEDTTIGAHFPSPPARVLVGAAGGGREAFALAERGYAVVAFEPSGLVELMAEARAGADGVEVYRARYDELPRVHTLEGGEVDLSSSGRFDAGIIGWASFSHLASDRERIDTLRSFAALVDGPVLVSFFGWIRPDMVPASTGLRRLLLKRFGERRPGSLFSIDVGLYRQLTEDDLRSMAAAAGVDVVAVDMKAEWPNAVLRRR
jgi:hypothetical protein